MNLINPANWDQLGYRRLGPKDQSDEVNTKALASIMMDSNLWDVKETGGEYWVRNYARIKGHDYPILLEKVSHITSRNASDENVYGFACEYAQSQFAVPLKQKKVNWEQAVENVRAIQNTTDRWRGAYQFTSGISFMDPDLLAPFLKRHAVPEFLKEYPHGEIVSYRTSFSYDYRFSVIRVGYTVQQYSISEINAAQIKTCETLKFWHASDTHIQPSILVSLASILLYPQITHIESGPFGLVIIFIFDKSQKQPPKHFPSSWLDIAKSESYFGQQNLDISKYFSEPDSAEAERMVHRRYLSDANFSAVDISSFLQWLIDRYNSILFHLSDPCEFVSDNFIDFIWAFEQNLTFDRILRIAHLCISSDEATTRKNLVFEIADLIEELRALWTSENANGDWFKELFNPRTGHRLVQSCFENIPQPFKGELNRVAEECYSELIEVSKRSVWIKTKLRPNGVMVKDRYLRNEREENWFEFTANLMRAFRNTHHGYLTRSDPGNRPSRYLALVNGDMPDSISMLGPLWAIALIADPERMIGWRPLPVSFYD